MSFDLAGHIPDEYRVLKRLGNGLFGECFKARQRHTGRLFAIKIEKQVGDSRSEREACILELLQAREGSIRIVRLHH